MTDFFFQHCDWLALCFSIIGLWFNGRKSMKCWPCWFTSNVLWTCYALATSQPSLVVLQVFFFFFNLVGWRSWKADEAFNQSKDEQDARMTQAYLNRFPFYETDPKLRREYMEGTWPTGPDETDAQRYAREAERQRRTKPNVRRDYPLL